MNNAQKELHELHLELLRQRLLKSRGPNPYDGELKLMYLFAAILAGGAAILYVVGLLSLIH